MLTLLLIEDDIAIRTLLKLFLQKQPYQVLTAGTGSEAWHLLNAQVPDIIVVDWMLPDTDGLSLIEKIRDSQRHAQTPVLMLTARSEEEDKISGLNSGADDYLTKPVSLKELAARLRALLRRSHGLKLDQSLHIGGIILNPETVEIHLAGNAVDMGGVEYRLLYYFMRHANTVLSREHLLDAVWGQAVYVEDRTVDVHIMRLRKILKRYQLDSMLETVRGMGYRLSDKTRD